MKPTVHIEITAASRELVRRKAARDGQRKTRAAADLIARGAEAEGLYLPEKKGPRK